MKIWQTSLPSDHAHLTGAVVPGLPPIKHIAAGRSHVLVSDGEAVWGFGRWMDEEGGEGGGAPFWEPAELLRLPMDGVLSLHCGPHCSGVVTGGGRVWMWGRLLDSDDANLLLERSGEIKALDGESPGPPGDVCWEWAGFGAPRPTLVEGLTGVRSLAIGGWHALALVD